jgi:MoxR-like ATPase
MDALLLAIETNTPVILVGPPGVGKTSTLYQLAKVNDAHLEVVIASLRDPTDFAGLPIKVVRPNEDPSVYLAPPRWARNLKKAAEEGQPAWLLIDEASTAAPATQAALLRVVLDRVVGDLTLPPEVRMLLAANPAEQAAGGWDIAPPLANRLFWLPFTTTATAWTDGILNDFRGQKTRIALPKDWENTIPLKRALIAGYIRAAGTEALLSVPKDENKASGPWPSPRTWTMAMRLLAAREAAGLDEDLDTALLTGSVGEAQAIQFFEWLRAQDLPNPEDLLADPDSFELPGRGDLVYTVLNSVVGAAIADLTPARWEAAWKILASAAQQGSTDVAAAAARTLAAQHRPDLPPAHEWVKPFVPMLVEAGLIRGGAK